MFVLQALIVVLLVAAAVGELLLQADNDSRKEAASRSLAAAEAFANAPGLVPALRSPDPTAILQPRAETARMAAQVDFIVVTNTQGIRYTHPLPSRIGKKFVGDMGPVLAGRPVVEQIRGTIGPLVQANVPVFDTGGKVVGMVSAGITLKTVSNAVDQELPLLTSAAAVALALATGGTALVSRRLQRQTHGLGPAEMARMYEHHDAVLHSVREGVLILDGSGRLLLANDEARRLLDLPAGAEGSPVGDLGLAPAMAELLASGREATDETLPAGDRLLAVNNRPTDRYGGPPGSVATLRDSTELKLLSSRAERARRRLKLLYEASVAIGTTLDVRRTAEELVDVTVPGFADFATVDLAEPVLRGEEPAPADGVRLRRVAVRGVRDDHPFFPLGRQIAVQPATLQAAVYGGGQALLVNDLPSSEAWQRIDRERSRRVLQYGVRSLITVPLRARGVLLGMVNFWRSDETERFEEDDLSLAEELVTRSAVCMDNARRYTREHTMAVTLQHSLLPRSLPGQSALDVAYRYLPAQAGVGGDWFDVIPLPGARVALVVGDVVGHGLRAAATMGRLRTAVHNFSSLDLAPDELLGHLDELVGRIDQEEAEAGDEVTIAGATCLYAIYDPVSRRCTLARAGHMLPVVVHPDGSADYPELPAGPPLGLGGLLFERAELELPEGSQLVLYTDGLVEDRERDIDVGLELLRSAVAAPGREPEETCEAVLDAVLPPHPTDDVALLVARTRVLPRDDIADWEVEPDPAAVAKTRAAVAERLESWGLEDLEFTTELILSELITNAIRYGAPPIRVRLIRDDAHLICEVSDSSSTSPHLRYAAATDEGGRGLFLVAQFAERWGTRYTLDGKVIWAEQPLAP
jgi:PAS domain-containing protein/anti-sigma regulatory factor (Ser/Thr protein kinase)